MQSASVEQGKIEIDINAVSCLCVSHFGCFISTYNLERAITSKWGPAWAPLWQLLRVNCLLAAPAPAEWCMALGCQHEEELRRQAAYDLNFCLPFCPFHKELPSGREPGQSFATLKHRNGYRRYDEHTEGFKGKKVMKIISHYNHHELPYISI